MRSMRAHETNFWYELKVPNGVYAVTLMFCELVYSNSKRENLTSC